MDYSNQELGISDKEVRDEILRELQRFTQSESEAREFLEWIEDNGWVNYDSRERWEKNRRVILTSTLYKIYSGLK